MVCKLLQIVCPDRVFFGEKDYQQLVLIRQMVADLNIDVAVVGVPTVREADGLAMSSRNAYLDPQQRKQALALYRSLLRVQTLAATGERSAAKLVEAAQQLIAEESGVRLDYLEVVDPQTLDPVAEISRGALVAVAAFVGTTRLIDNIVLHGAGEACSAF